MRARQRSDLGRVDKIEIFVIPAEAGIYKDVHQVIIGLKTPGFRFKTGMTGYLSTRPRGPLDNVIPAKAEMTVLRGG